MSAPTAPTLVSITTEGLKKAGHKSPSSALLTRAQDEWMQETKNDIWTLEKKLIPLQTTSVAITVNGQGRYSMPTDYASDLSLTILHGTHIGTAQDGTASTLQLASDEDITEAEILGKEVLIYAGTGKNSLAQCISYNTSTKWASFTPNFATTPVTGDSYMVVDFHKPLDSLPIQDRDRLTIPTIKSLPSHYYPVGDGDYGEVILWPVPYNADAVYGLKMRYYANLMTVDLASTLMSTLYNRWRNVFTYGVYAKALDSNDDSRADAALVKYMNMVRGLVLRETYGIDINNLQMKVHDY